MIVCTAGHRPSGLPGGYSVETAKNLARVAAMAIEATELTKVITGMALGWDQALANAAHLYGIEIVAAVPFQGFDGRWPEASRKEYRRLLGAADQIIYVDELDDERYKARNKFLSLGTYSPIKMQTRNTWMVDHSDAIYALWSGSSGGTANCLEYARKVNKPICNFWNDFIGV